MSGKSARRIRKNHVFSKKTLAICAGLCLSYAPVSAGGDFLVSVFPHFTKPFGEAHSMEYGIGVGLRATYRPIRFINIFAEGDYLSMSLPGVAPVSILEGKVGGGYHLEITDRISLDFNLDVGLYSARANKNTSGISAGGSIVFSYKINPSIYLDTSATATHYASKPTPLMLVNAGIAPGVTFNVTEFFNKKTKLDMEVDELAPVFPVLYSWYENNSFGKVNITNKEDSAITDVTVSFFQPQYMAHAKECTTIAKIKRGETVSVDLLAFFNETMLELTEKTDASSYIIVNYSRLGKKMSQSFALDVPVYGRNNMSWDDDRRAAVFVSSKDPAAMQFAKYTASIVRDNLHADVPVNIQYAIGIFETLNEFGLNYVVDPSSSFEDNVGTSSIDFLQFPYQTLMYRGGDCDDLSILVCSLFEAVGIDTAFITVPGHIFMAFDSGLTPEQALMSFRNTTEFIFDKDKVWIPLEITLSDEGFFKACRYGAREWNTSASQGTAALYRMSDSWKIYQPISVPGATAYFNMPESDAIYLAFENGLDRWSRHELKNRFSDYNVNFAMLDQSDESQEAETVIKSNALSSNALLEIISLANNVAALSPSAVREKESDSEDEVPGNEGGSGDDDEDELIENLLPLEFALATLQTDVPIKSDNSSGETITSVALSDEEYEIASFAETEDAEEAEESEEESPLDSLQALAAEFMASDPTIAKVSAGKYVAKAEQPASVEKSEPAEKSADVAAATTTANTTANTPATESKFESVETFNQDLEASAEKAESFESVEEFTKELEKAAESKASARNIIIISSVTLAATLAAGIIIFGKKKKREEGNK